MARPAGTRLGPYEILEPLGAGGMGEVYRARDPRLDREVAVKVLRSEVSADPDRLRRFEREARTVAALNHPCILTVFDVGTHEGAPYVVTELLEGQTLRAVTTWRIPTREQVLAFAVQIARGLAAAHDKDIVHRDLKPENLFVTTDGRVKILDFGLAKLAVREATSRSAATPSAPVEHRTSPGVILGTVAYMSPEQTRAHALDTRSDVFSFGVVLYEMLAGQHPFLRETAAATLAAIVDDTPPNLVSLGRGIPPALARLVHRCLEKRREDRFRDTHDLALALEALLQAPSGAAVLEEVEERSPYPGLNSFTERDAAVFFGREGEVKALWERLRSRNLLAVIGPSGSGKTSFIRAGVLPGRPEGWGAVRATPGAQPALGLARALTPELTTDPDAVGELLGGVSDLARTGEAGPLVSALKRWRARYDEVLLVVDQFEELFTLNPPETQASFAAVLGQLVSEADIHVVLSLRDDFLIRCSEQAALAPVFESLTPLTALTPEALRLALTEPARALGYRFEDDALVEEMVESVDGARAALPLLAFAVARLWEKRDRKGKQLTRTAYTEIGGVAGALAQHAEEALERIGAERQGMVREIFRTLVTAHGTRAAADREDLLSLFPDRGAAEEVLGELIDARLLTSYEATDPRREVVGWLEPESSSRATHRIEIVHESLVKAWPRLVRWQAQDEEGAVLRDQLKQAAHLWEEKGRSLDLLWTSDAFQEFQLWRRRYPGALTALEEEFAVAMADLAARRRRRRQAVAVAVVAAAIAVAAVTGVLWNRARAEALRAEAGKLLALAKVSLEDDSTAALAYTRGSLDLYDTPEARRFALEILWRGPVARILDLSQTAKTLGLQEEVGRINGPVFSPDGRWMDIVTGTHLLFDRDGGPTRTLSIPWDETAVGLFGFGPRSDLLVQGGPGPSLTYWSLPDLREVRRVLLPSLPPGSSGKVRGGKIVFYVDRANAIQVMDFSAEGPPASTTVPSGWSRWEGADSEGTRIVVVRPPRRVALLSLDGTSRLHPLAELPADFIFADGSLRGDRVVASDASGQAHVWSRSDRGWGLLRTLQGPAYGGVAATILDPQGRELSQAGPNASHVLWDLEEFPDAEPLVLGRPGPSAGRQETFGPSGQWLVTGDHARSTVEFWPVASPRRRVLPGLAFAPNLIFSPDSRWLTTCPIWQPVKQWPLRATDGDVGTFTPEGGCATVAAHPAGREVLVGTMSAKVLLYAFSGGPPRRLVESWEGAEHFEVAFDPRGLQAVAVPLGNVKAPESRALLTWDLASGEKRVYSVAHLTDASWGGWLSPTFAPDGRLYVAGQGGVRRLTLPTDADETVSSETIHAAGFAGLDLSRDGRRLLVSATMGSRWSDPREDLLLFDLVSDTSRRIKTHGKRLSSARLSPSGRVIVTGDHDGTVRVGPASGEEPHVLLGHTGPVLGLAISPDERWIASSTDESISIWPMPDVTRPSLHTLPHDELLATLDALTNLRVVRDPTSSTGWTEEIGPFPGWKDVPSW